MVGYLKPDFGNAPKEYKKTYKTFYCGLCKALKSQYNYIGILSLNYEITAFLLLLSGLRENEQIHFHGSCSISPFVPVRYVDYLQSDLIKAAHLSVLIAYYEILDNTKDIGSAKWKVIEKYASKKSKKSIDFLKDNYEEIKEAINDFYDTENSGTATFMKIVESDGELIKTFLSTLTNQFDVDTTNNLLELSKLLGKWIYLIDACDDLQEDSKKNNFNPLFLLDDVKNVERIINSIEYRIEEIIKDLPIFSYKELINYIFIFELKRKGQQYLSKITN